MLKRVSHICSLLNLNESSISLKVNDTSSPSGACAYVNLDNRSIELFLGTIREEIDGLIYLGALSAHHNKDELLDAFVAKALAHELRHVHQIERGWNVESTLFLSFNEYINHPLEVDARRFQNQYLETYLSTAISRDMISAEDLMISSSLILIERGIKAHDLAEMEQLIIILLWEGAI